MANNENENINWPDDLLMKVNDLKVNFYQAGKIIKAVRGVSFQVKKNHSLGIVGESGSGKTVTVRSLMNLLPRSGAKIENGEVLFKRSNGEIVDMLKLDSMGKKIQKIRGNEISMVFQQPMSSLNPVYDIGMQIGEVFKFHSKKKKSEIQNEVIKLLDSVNLPKPKDRINSYPFQLSGGMNQRAMIAMALAANPQLLICDEPTTALDVTVQDKILYLLEKIKEKYECSILYISHDLAVVSELVDEIIVMYLGEIMEYGNAKEIFDNPLHPYTELLLKSIPELGRKQKKLEIIEGEIPRADEEISGCVFETRCPKAMHICKQPPPSITQSNGHIITCWLYSQEAEQNGK